MRYHSDNSLFELDYTFGTSSHVENRCFYHFKVRKVLFVDINFLMTRKSSNYLTRNGGTVDDLAYHNKFNLVLVVQDLDRGLCFRTHSLGFTPGWHKSLELMSRITIPGFLRPNMSRSKALSFSIVRPPTPWKNTWADWDKLMSRLNLLWPALET